ncbi:imidazolonepropionase [Knoellia remsis]|uniref:Imidazolonepropionase n=1 Tax=Knoellia remsis TaxID=407159 RepID=A0A2T0UGQ3_9MICO|nr:imidazolonepropionase [Knoellia remsis]PRY57130.1 imidazolonepropionase [Knoellia remsis]
MTSTVHAHGAPEPTGSTAYVGIGELVTCDGTGEVGLGMRRDAAVVVEDGLVAWVGESADAPAADRRVDLEGRAVLPGFVDSHSHLVFDGDRAAEFAARMTGERYDGGGIGVSVAATRAASDERLRELVAARVAEMRAQGTTTVEIKSGYGLTVEDEARALRIARELTPETTFLGAHVVPEEARGDRTAYVDLVTGPMLEACAPYARWADVFCEPNSPHAFTEDESRAILLAARDAGLELRVHGNQLGPGPGVQLAVELGAASVDHCTYLSDADVDALVQAADTTCATLLPGVEFSTRSPYPDARALLDAGVSVALATDCNPGTCYSDSMPFVIALAVREMGMTPSEAVYAATAGSAKALRRGDVGRVAVGGPADLAVLEAPSHLHLAYRAGVPIARTLATAADRTGE